MKYWYGLIVLVCLLIITSFVFSGPIVSKNQLVIGTPLSQIEKPVIEPFTITETTDLYLIENKLTQINKNKVSCIKGICITSIKWGVIPIIFKTSELDDKNNLKDDKVILQELDEKSNQWINTEVTRINRTKSDLDTKSKLPIRIIRNETTQVIASPIDEKGEVTSVTDSKVKVDVKESCLILIPFLEWCIWK